MAAVKLQLRCVMLLFFLQLSTIVVLSSPNQGGDFDFADKTSLQADAIAPNVDHTYVDDEDHEYGSGIDGPVDSAAIRIRATINVTSLAYSSQLGDQTSDEFATLARRVKDAIESEYLTVPGQQTVDVLQFRPGTMDTSVEQPVMVTFDLSSVGYYNQLALFNVLNGSMNRGWVGIYRVTPDGFSIKQIESDSSVNGPGSLWTCGPNEFRCYDGACIDIHLKCDGQFDCTDKSDEYLCVPQEQTACQEAVQEVYQEGGGVGVPLPPGTYVPQCDEDGEYKPLQLGGGSGQSWCVDRDGTEIPGTRTPPGKPPPTCPSFSRPDQLTACQSAAEEARRQQTADEPSVAGVYVPQCDEQGSYHPLQVHSSTGYRWCVDEHGREITGTNTPPGKPEPDCSQFNGEATPAGRCAAAEFTCFDGGCVDDRRRCDGYPDCRDQSDELECEVKETCSPEEVSCDNGNCIEQRQRCNGEDNCGDGSDERDCPATSRCYPTEFRCDDGTCIDDQLLCDQHVDCPDGSDEQECPPSRDSAVCNELQFQCVDDATCIDSRRRCDGYTDCRDGSDETDCRDGADRCQSWEFECQSGECIDARLKCDGNRDCDDATDEVDCDGPSCSPGQFTCEDGSCIPVRLQCDGVPDCDDRSDEHGCVMRCSSEEFTCGDGSCIDAGRRCDQHEDCPDGSDEANCGPSTTCQSWEFKCDGGECVDARLRCDGNYDCPDATDEFDCEETPPTSTCAYYQFTCRDGSCIDERQRCDGRPDCPDGFDERECDTPTQPACTTREFTCNDGTCIDSALRCDNKYDCRDGSDEFDCVEATTPSPSTCAYYEFQCRDGSCIDERQTCDGRPDCSDGFDELECEAATPTPSACAYYQFQCRDGSCIDERQRCDGRPDCSDGFDELECAPTDAPEQCEYYEFTCRDGSCIDNRQKCDGTPHCRDGSDEFDCGETTCAYYQFACRDGSCIDQRQRCDGRPDCPDGFDESECDGSRCQYYEFACRDGSCIDNSRKCDGTPDCEDGSDEFDCDRRVVLSASPSQLRVRVGVDATFICRIDGQIATSQQVRWSRSIGSLPRQATDADGRLSIPQVNVEDSGQYICTALDAAAGAQPATVTLIVDDSYGPTMTPPSPGHCERGEVPCNNGACIPLDYLCDGDYDCTDRSDEANCVSRLPCEPNESQCDNGKCIVKIWQCDGDDDCGGDRSDERDCGVAPPGAQCRVDEYQCRTGSQCVLASYHCDGEPDCHDQSDEIGCALPTVTRPPPGELMVQEGETITIECTAIGVPPPLIVWRLNWGLIGDPPRTVTTIETTARQIEQPGVVTSHSVLTITDSRKADEGAYTCEALNAKGSIFAVPDTIVHIVPPSGVCQVSYFNAEARRTGDCIRCFCFGQTESCSSSNMFISQILPGSTINLASQREPHDTSDERLVEFNSQERSFTIRDYARRVRGTDRYFSLPSQFLGNKVTSYGGKLSYTIYYDTGRYPADYLQPGPDVIISGNDITLYHSQHTVPFTREQETDVPLIPGSWTRDEEGRSRVSREDLMMVLQNIDYILIKSSYDQNQDEVRLSQISMATTSTRDTGLGRAVLVEQCDCPSGYSGTSCERCTTGFTRVPGGRYLGQCVGCNCHGHSDECDDAGQCLNCQHNTEGPQCGRCRPGYYGNAQAGTPRDCSPCPCPLTTAPNQFTTECHLDTDGEVTCVGCPEGYTGRRCQRCAEGYEGDPTVPGGSCRFTGGGQCDQRGSVSRYPDPATGECQCKRHVVGTFCSECDEGSFYLSEQHEFGCVRCFCMGHTKICDSTTYNRAQVTASFTSSDTQGFTLSDELGLTTDDPPTVNTRDRELVYRQVPDGEYYWELPDKFTGNKITSYGGRLRYKVSYVAGFNRQPTTYPDIEIVGSDILLVHRRRDPIPQNTPTTVEVPLLEQHWGRPDGGEATREHLMMLLADLKSIRIKAKYSEETSETSLSEVSLDIAEDRETGQSRAFEVEHCQCPAGYRGISCEECDVGYKRSGGGFYLGTCDRCDCHGHADECSPIDGLCINCRHNTAGDQCHICAPGYYGDATRGTPNDCRPCPCPLTTPANQFSPTCELDRRGSVICTQCQPGYTGPDCGDCARGYTGDPRRPGGRCDPTGPNYLDVIIDEPKTQTIRVGANVRFYCRTITAPLVYTLAWTRQDGRPLPPSIVDDGMGTLTIRSAQPDDAGTYVCTGSDYDYHNDTDFAILIVTGGRFEIPVCRLVEDRIVVDVDSSMEFHCIASGTPEPQIEWSRPEGARLPSHAVIQNGYLRISRVRREDQGEYICIALNAAGQAEVTGTLIVREERYEPPTARVEPSYVVIRTGEMVEVRCIVTGYPEPSVEWTYTAGSLPSDARVRDGLLRFRATRRTEGEYRCMATSSVGEDHATVTVVIEEIEIEVIVDPPSITLREGEVAQFDCSAGSHVDVDSIDWSREGDRLPEGASQRGGRLTIRDTQPRDSGQYLCTVYFVDGDRRSAHASLVVERVRPREERPTVTIDHERVSVTEGSSVTINCVATGVPTPVIRWTKSYEPLPSHHRVVGGVFRIPLVRQEDRGVYICEAENSAGTDFATVTIEIERHEAPEIELYPSSVLTVDVGDSATFECRVLRGYPSPTLAWTRANNKVMTSRTEVLDNGVLRFRDVTTEEQGGYVCTASNSAGTVNVMALLNVRGVTVIPTIKPAGPLTLTVDESLTLECIAEGDPDARVVWVPPHTSSVAEVEGRGSAIMRVRPVTEDEAGTFTCYIYSGVEEYEETIEIIVERAGEEDIEISTWTSSPRVVVGSRVELRCTVTTSGLQQPDIRWSKIDGALPVDHVTHDGTLIINQVSADDAGVYECIATGAYRTTRSRMELFILVPPRIIIQESTETLRPRDLFRVTCEAFDPLTNEHLRVEWSRDHAELPSSATVVDGTLEIVSVTSADAGLYRCTASNEAGVHSAVTELVIFAPPGATISPRSAHMAPGAQVEFRCDVTGSPRPRIQWSKEDGELPRRHSIVGSTLTLFDLEEHDSGRYICTVSNDAGSTRDIVQLTVTGDPVRPPTIPARYETVTIGDRVTMTCTQDDPRARLEWTKLDGELDRDVIMDDGTLIIPYVLESHQGTYRCTTTTVLGTSYMQFILTVEAPPSAMLMDQSRTVSRGNRATLTCPVRGNPPPRVQWYKRGGTLPSDHTVENGVLLIPVVREEDFGVYVCSARNKHGFIEATTEIIPGELVPHFEQSDAAYVGFPGIHDAYEKFDLEMSFKPETTDGLMLYSGHLDDGSGDFISFGMRNRRAEFRLDVGSGPAVVTSEPLELERWHTVRIRRDRKDVVMYIGDMEFKAQAPGPFVGLDLNEELYVGAVPDFSRIARAAGFASGFTGCISRLVISGTPVNLGADILDSKDITDCPVCSSRTCNNGGSCQAAATNNGFRCLCPRNYSGDMCQLVGDKCTPTICENGGVCYDVPTSVGGGYHCACPVGLHGSHCELGTQIGLPQFNRSSFIAYQTIRDALFTVDIRLVFKATSLDDGILLYNAYNSSGFGDFIALSIHDQRVVFQFDTGAGPGEFISDQPLQLNEWTTVIAERNRNDGSLIVNDAAAVKGTGPGQTIGLNLKSWLYVGGVDWTDVRVSPSVPVDVGFVGCIAELSIGGFPIHLSTAAVANKNITECQDERSPVCGVDTCRNGGTCRLLGAEAFQCHCPFGFSGTRCEQRVSVNWEAEFAGEGSYIELTKRLLPHSREAGDEEIIKMTVTTDVDDALLFWQGQTPTISGRGKDYIAIAVENGYPVFSYNLGSGAANITGHQRIDDGNPHVLVARRAGRRGSLEVDGDSSGDGESGGILTGLNTSGNLYIGGVPDARLMTAGKFLHAFVGCISDVYIQALGPIDFSEHAISGVNVQPCFL